MNQENLLVSVVVIAYNSSKYILETLESVKAQTYQNIELIISDDCSLDNTVELCQIWLEENKKRFVRTEIILSIKNNGISTNCNKGYKKAHGSWIKSIAGDDILLPNCIADNIEFINTHPNVTIVFSKMQGFKEGKLYGDILPNAKECVAFKLLAESQLINILRNNFATAPTAFINSVTIRDNGYFDEKYPFLEDYPLWVKLLKKGLRMDFLDKLTVYYRLEDSITRKKDSFVSLLFYESYKSFLLEIVFPLCKSKKMYFTLYVKYIYIAKMEFAIHFLKNKITPFNVFLIKLISLLDFNFLFNNK